MCTVVLFTMSYKWRACSQAKDDDDDDDDDGGSDDDGDDDDDNGNEMMIRALRVSWVNCGKVGGL